MTESQQVYSEDFIRKPTDGQRPEGLWAAIAPPIAWWWLVIAGAAALILGLGTLNFVQLFAQPLALFVLGIAIATSLAPLVNWFSRWLPRVLVVLLLYVVLLLGALVAIPLAAALRVLVIDVIAPMVRRWSGAAPAPETQGQ